MLAIFAEVRAMRFLLTVSLAVLVAVLCSSFALADPASDLAQMQASFASIRSVHFDITTRDNKHISIDMVKPDRYRGTLVNSTQVVIIGSTTWIMKNGHWQVDPSATGAKGDYLQAARTPLNGHPASEYTVVDLGQSNVGSATARHYRVTRAGSQMVDNVWVGANHLPLRVQHTEPRGTTVILFSQYNSVPPINPPM
jgi:outer membrane lipoprotein-sorting protein